MKHLIYQEHLQIFSPLGRIIIPDTYIRPRYIFKITTMHDMTTSRTYRPTRRQPRRGEAGLTLIDVAVALLIIGLFVVPLLSMYNSYQSRRAMDKTKAHFLAIQSAIAEYYFEHDGIYPCPANPGLGPTNAGYGMQLAGCAAGIGPVSSGAVPFVDLKIPAEISLDGWGNKITYNITRAMTALPLPVPNYGVMTVTSYVWDDTTGTQTTKSYTPPPNLAHYVLVSHGTNGAGAYNENGTAFACPSAAPIPLEAENCDGDVDFWSEFQSHGDVAGADYFDDLTWYATAAPSRIWDFNGAIGATDDIFTGALNVGINTTTPLTELDVNGDIRADDALESDNFCLADPTDPDCFFPGLIGGTGSQCGTGAMRGIGNSNVECTQTINPGTDDQCPANSFVVGFDASGNVKCAP